MRKLSILFVFQFLVLTTMAQFKVLYNFDNASGINPQGRLTLVGNRLYGMTYQGGGSNGGTIFSIDSTGKAYHIIFNCTLTSGNTAHSSLLSIGSKLYGTTYQGGANSMGTIFSIDTSGANHKILYSLSKSSGYYSWCNISAIGNKLFGMASFGGVHDSGTIFSLDTNGGDFKVLYDLSSTSGCIPGEGSLIKIGGRLCGMTDEGGANYGGTIFSIDTNGITYNVAYNFDNASGLSPASGLTLWGNKLYGMTNSGGANGYGTIFSIDVSALTGINDLAKHENELKVYPNPTSGVTNFQLGIQNQKTEVDVYTILGERVQSFISNNSQFTIDLSSQSTGIYFIRISADSSTVVTKLIKN